MKNKVFPISMTVLWGMTFATALHSLTLGICMGMMMGIAFGLFDSDNKDDQKKIRVECTTYGGYNNERAVC